MLNVADSLFYAENFGEAIEIYKKIRAAKPKNEESITAHFQCAAINIYYKNANADWSEALNEFKSFASQYPNDPRTAEALSWVRVLTVLKSFDAQFRSSVSQVDRLKYFGKQAVQSKQYFHDSMSVILRNCYESREDLRDSMASVNRRLENVIINLEKKCQQAGR